MKGSLFLKGVTIAAVALAGAAAANAQCEHTGGSSPVIEPMLADMVRVYTGPGGSWGDGNDRVLIAKGDFAAASFDPLNTHQVHITLKRNEAAGALVYQASLPAGSSFWTQVGPTFKYFDPSDTHGVRRLQIRDMGGGTYRLFKLVGRDLSLPDPPLTSTDTFYLELEIESGGGTCLAKGFTFCSYFPTTQRCY